MIADQTVDTSPEPDKTWVTALSQIDKQPEPGVLVAHSQADDENHNWGKGCDSAHASVRTGRACVIVEARRSEGGYDIRVERQWLLHDGRIAGQTIASFDVDENGEFADVGKGG